MLLMGKSTISTGQFSSSQTVSLPEGSGIRTSWGFEAQTWVVIKCRLFNP